MTGNVDKVLEKLIDFTALKNKVVSKNIANIGTENYQREDVVFKNVLQQNIQTPAKPASSSNEKYISDLIPEDQFDIVRDPSRNKVSGINNVDIDREMSDLAENTLMFKFGSRKLNEYYRLLQSAIKGESKL